MDIYCFLARNLTLENPSRVLVRAQLEFALGMSNILTPQFPGTLTNHNYRIYR